MSLIQKLKLMWTLKDNWSKVKGVIKMKSGWKTTEFWISIFSIVASLYGSFKGMIPADLSVKIIAIAGCVYSIARAVAKITPTTKDDEILDKIDELFKGKPAV